MICFIWLYSLSKDHPVHLPCCAFWLEVITEMYFGFLVVLGINHGSIRLPRLFMGRKTEWSLFTILHHLVTASSFPPSLTPPGPSRWMVLLFNSLLYHILLDISWVIKSHQNTANNVAWQTLYKTEELKGSVRTLLCLVKFLYGAYRQKRQSRLRASGPFPLTLESQKKFSNKTRECVFLSEMGPKQHFFLNKMSQVSDFHFSYVNFIIFLWVFFWDWWILEDVGWLILKNMPFLHWSYRARSYNLFFFF